MYVVLYCKRRKFSATLVWQTSLSKKVGRGKFGEFAEWPIMNNIKVANCMANLSLANFVDLPNSPN